MAHTENTIQNRKNKHLSPFERAPQTINNELKRGTTTQLKTGRKPFKSYFPETGQAVYRKNRKNCGAKSKLLELVNLSISHVKKIPNKGWSPDAVVGFVKQQPNWKVKPIVSAKTLYNYIDQSLLSVRNIDLPLKTKLNTKPKRIAQKNRKFFGRSISERPSEIEERVEFGHWEIDTVEGHKSGYNALLALVERKTRNYFAIKIDDQDHDSVDYAIKKLQDTYGELFPKVFKTITTDNGSEFSNLTRSLEGVTDVYFANPYASYERGSNECHNGLLRRYIPKGKAISDYSRKAIKRIYQTLNHLPRKILNYQQPAVLIEQELARLA